MNQADLRPYLSDSALLPRTTTLLRESGLHVMLLRLKSGEQIPEHQATGAISVHCLQGEVSFTAETETVELPAGLLISIPAKRPHRLVARQDSLLLVTRTEPAAVPGS